MVNSINNTLIIIRIKKQHSLEQTPAVKDKHLENKESQISHSAEITRSITTISITGLKTTRKIQGRNQGLESVNDDITRYKRRGFFLKTSIF